MIKSKILKQIKLNLLILRKNNNKLKINKLEILFNKILFYYYLLCFIIFKGKGKEFINTQVEPTMKEIIKMIKSKRFKCIKLN
jgi:hypothetical protein